MSSLGNGNHAILRDNIHGMNFHIHIRYRKRNVNGEDDGSVTCNA